MLKSHAYAFQEVTLSKATVGRQGALPKMAYLRIVFRQRVSFWPGMMICRRRQKRRASIFLSSDGPLSYRLISMRACSAYTSIRLPSMDSALQPATVISSTDRIEHGPDAPALAIARPSRLPLILSYWLRHGHRAEIKTLLAIPRRYTSRMLVTTSDASSFPAGSYVRLPRRRSKLVTEAGRLQSSAESAGCRLPAELMLFPRSCMEQRDFLRSRDDCKGIACRIICRDDTVKKRSIV